MASKKKNHKRALQEGATVQLQREDGETLRGVVMRIEDDLLDVVVRARVEQGELLRLSRTVQNDARYTAVIEVVESGTGRSRVRLVGDWQRIQMREYVRVSVFGIPLDVRRDEELETMSQREARLRRLRAVEEDERPSRLLDLSGGGLRFESRERFSEGENVEFDFTLPETGPLHLRGEIVRVLAVAEANEDAGEPEGFNQYGVRFLSVAESDRVKIMTWVFGEQAARFRESK